VTKCKYHAMHATHSSASIVTGVTNFKPITRLESAIDAIHSYAKNAKIWINATIAAKSFANPVARS